MSRYLIVTKKNNEVLPEFEKGVQGPFDDSQLHQALKDLNAKRKSYMVAYSEEVANELLQTQAA